MKIGDQRGDVCHYCFKILSKIQRAAKTQEHAQKVVKAAMDEHKKRLRKRKAKQG